MGTAVGDAFRWRHLALDVTVLHDARKHSHWDFLVQSSRCHSSDLEGRPVVKHVANYATHS